MRSYSRIFLIILISKLVVATVRSILSTLLYILCPRRNRFYARALHISFRIDTIGLFHRHPLSGHSIVDIWPKIYSTVRFGFHAGPLCIGASVFGSGLANLRVFGDWFRAGWFVCMDRFEILLLFYFVCAWWPLPHVPPSHVGRVITSGLRSVI